MRFSSVTMIRMYWARSGITSGSPQSFSNAIE